MRLFNITPPRQRIDPSTVTRTGPHPVTESAGRSKWLLSGGEKKPPHRPPRRLHPSARNAQISKVVREAGRSPTLRSAASEGQRVCSESGASGLSSAWNRRDRKPLMMKSPGQRSPSAENCRAAHWSRRTSISARIGSKTHSRDRLQLSSPTRLDRNVLPQGHREHPD